MANHSEAGKGSGRRPMEVDQEEFNDNWELAFGKKEPEPEPEPEETIEVYNTDLVFAYCRVFRDRLVEIIKEIPIDEDGDVPALNANTLHEDLMNMAQDMTALLYSLWPHMVTEQ